MTIVFTKNLIGNERIHNTCVHNEMCYIYLCMQELKRLTFNTLIGLPIPLVAASAAVLYEDYGNSN